MKVIILMGPCAAGKDTVLKGLEEKGITPLISYTTRPMRPGEQRGREYFFTDDEGFDAIADGLIETRTFKTKEGKIWKYGLHKTLNNGTEAGINAVIVDADGAQELKDYFGDNAYLIYLDADAAIRKERAIARDPKMAEAWDVREADDHRLFDNISKRFPEAKAFTNNGSIEKAIDDIYTYICTAVIS